VVVVVAVVVVVDALGEADAVGVADAAGKDGLGLGLASPGPQAASDNAMMVAATAARAVLRIMTSSE
jgi:hypothetical protein